MVTVLYFIPEDEKQNIILKDSNEHRCFLKYANFFNKIEYKIFTNKIIQGENYPLYEQNTQKTTKLDYIVCRYEYIDSAKKFLQKKQLTQTPVIGLHYDLNKLQADLEINCPQKLFLDINKIENNIPVCEIFDFDIVENHKKHIPDNINTEQIKIVEDITKNYITINKEYEHLTKPYQTGQNWKEYLQETRQDFYKAVDNNNIKYLTELFSNFYRNCLTTGTLGGKEAFDSYNNSQGYSRWLSHNFNVWSRSLKSLGIEPTNISQLKLPLVGNPYGINIDGNIINVNSFLFNYRANFCKNLLKKNKKIVLEIGGGFGLLGHYLANIDCNCTYINLDIPENLIVSEYFLKMAYPQKKFLNYSKDLQLTRENLLNYDFVLLPNFTLKKFEDLSADMIINTISFGEMGYDTICEYFSQIDRIGCNYFYHENIANSPEYLGYPVETYPKLKNFQQINTAISRWKSFDAHSPMYIYTENLYLHKTNI